MNGLRGFTLVELMVTLAVLAIVAGLAVPNLNTFIQSNRVTGHANAMVSALNFSRSEAVSRSENVRFCPVNESLDGCRESSDWSAGWIAVVESGPDAGEVLRVWPPIPDRIAVDLSTSAVISEEFIDMLPLGNVETGGGTFQFQWTLRPEDCREGRPFQRSVDLAPSGRSQVIREAC